MSEPELSRAERLSRKREQARINGARSRGPVTPEGRARSARNGVRHGLRAVDEICLDEEDRVGFNRLHEALLNTMAPDCADGCQLVRQMALAMLQQERAARRERELWTPDGTYALLRLRELDLLVRYRNSAARAYHRARNALIELAKHPHRGVLLLGDHAERIPMPEDESTPEEAGLAAEHEAIVAVSEARQEAQVRRKIAESWPARRPEPRVESPEQAPFAEAPDPHPPPDVEPGWDGAAANDELIRKLMAG